MAVDLNIQMKKFNGTDYDILSPKTKAEITSYNNTLGSSLTSTNVQDVISEISSNVIIPATATHTTNITAITTGTVQVPNFTLTFVAPSDFVATDTYKLNNTVITLTDLNGLPVANGWKLGSPVTLNIIGTKAFFKSGGAATPKIPSYTGQTAIYGDAKKGYMELLTSGDLTFNSDLLIDIFLVGGGGAGRNDEGGNAGGGGGGGYTGTWIAQPFVKNQTMAVTIGRGGGGNPDGQATSLASTPYSASGGKGGATGRQSFGGDGGSGGGGGFGGNGGRGGGNGGSGALSVNGGLGQGTTTAAFRGDVPPFNRFFGSGGGGGGSGDKGGIAYDGAGWGGDGIYGKPKAGSNGTPNTGGGGGGAGHNTDGGGTGGNGGSGIAIIRWGY